MSGGDNYHDPRRWAEGGPSRLIQAAGRHPRPMWWRVQGSHWHTKSLIYLGLLMYQVSSYRQSYRQPTVLALECSDNPVLRYGVDCQIMLNSGTIARVRGLVRRCDSRVVLVPHNLTLNNLRR